MALSVEELMPKSCRCHLIEKSQRIKPNRVLKIFEKFQYFFYFGNVNDRCDSSENITSALHPPMVSNILFVVATQVKYNVRVIMYRNFVLTPLVNVLTKYDYQ